MYRSDSLKSNDSLSHENDIDALKAELENEKNYRENVLWRNTELEKAIVKLQEHLQKEDYDWEHDGELEKELKNVQELSDEIKKLKDLLPELKERIKNAKVCGKDCKMKHDNLNINLDVMDENELMKTAKRLERMRTDLKSALISKEWSLDNESKNYQRVLDQKTSLQNALYHNNTTPSARKQSSAIDRWQNGGITKPNRTLDVKKGPIKQTVACEKLPLQTKPGTPVKSTNDKKAK